MKSNGFDRFLQEKHAKEIQFTENDCLDDDLADAFDDWMDLLTDNDLEGFEREYLGLYTDSLKGKVDKIISVCYDYELAHIKEDELHVEIIKEFCPDCVIREVERLGQTKFARKCA